MSVENPGSVNDHVYVQIESQMKQSMLNRDRASVRLPTLNETKSAFAQAIGAWKAHNYQDKDFLADKSSIMGQYENEKLQSLADRVVWKRAKDFLGSRGTLFGSPLEASAVKQGELGDCYLLAAMIAIGARDEIVKEKIFLSDKYDDNGVYGVYLYPNGERKMILVDDFLPVEAKANGSLVPVFASSSKNEIWVSILEKAFAKVYSCYAAIEKGDPGTALTDLTGAPCEYKEEGDPDKLWAFLEECDNFGYIMCCYSLSDLPETANPDALALLPNHAFSILKIATVKSYEETDRLICIKDPWNKFIWDGDWSQHSLKWTKDAQAQIKGYEMADGVVWMSVKDFVTKFQGVCVCKYLPHFMRKSLKFKVKDLADTEEGEPTSTFLVRMYVHQKTHLFLSVHQKDERSIPPKAGFQYQYSYVRIMVAKMDKEGLKFVTGEYANTRDVTVELRPEDGEYLIMIEIDWMSKRGRDVTLSSVGEIEPDLEFSKGDTLTAQRNMFKDAILKQHPQLQKVNTINFEKFGIKEVFRSNCFAFGMLVFYYENHNPEYKFEDDVKMTVIEKMQICHPYADSTRFRVTVLPNQIKIVMFKVSIKSPDELAELKFAWHSSPTAPKLKDKKDLNPEDETTLLPSSIQAIIEEVPVEFDPDNYDNRPMRHEEAFADLTDILQFFVRSWAVFFMIAMLVWGFLSMFVSVMGTQFLDLCIWASIARMLYAKDVTILNCRHNYQLIAMSWVYDIIWIITIDWDNYNIFNYDRTTFMYNLLLQLKYMPMINKTVVAAILVRSTARIVKFKKDINRYLG